MKIILAVDILKGNVVHGYKGQRNGYKPLDWGIASSTIPDEYIREMGAKNVYLADLDRIEGFGDNNDAIIKCEGLAEVSILNRGAKKPSDALSLPWIKNVISTETCAGNQKDYPFDYFSVVIKDGRVFPDRSDPVLAFKKAADWGFKGGIVMNLSSVGTEDRMGGLDIDALRSAYPKELLYGGGVASTEDLLILSSAGYDGAIIATAVHKGNVPVSILREGKIC